jgi:hypothetical protein
MPLAAPVTIATLPANGWLVGADEVMVNISFELRDENG